MLKFIAFGLMLKEMFIVAKYVFMFMAVSCFMFLFSTLKLNSMIGFDYVQLQPRSLFCLDWKKTVYLLLMRGFT